MKKTLALLGSLGEKVMAGVLFGKNTSLSKPEAVGRLEGFCVVKSGFMNTLINMYITNITVKIKVKPVR